jgi:hypothetical protein
LIVESLSTCSEKYPLKAKFTGMTIFFSKVTLLMPKHGAKQQRGSLLMEIDTICGGFPHLVPREMERQKKIAIFSSIQTI